jgi:hypothetical protein
MKNLSLHHGIRSRGQNRQVPLIRMKFQKPRLARFLGIICSGIENGSIAALQRSPQFL